jgi:hypothetical protein
MVRDLHFVGGKLAGILNTVHGTPASSSGSQKVGPERRLVTPPPQSGMTKLPIVMFLSGGSVSVSEKRGFSVAGSRWMKSKIP